MASSPSRFFQADVPRLERAIAEAKKYHVDVQDGLIALEREMTLEAQRVVAKEATVIEGQRNSAEKELKNAMPGWLLSTDIPRLERAIREASQFGIDISEASAALKKEVERKEVRSSQSLKPTPLYGEGTVNGVPPPPPPPKAERPGSQAPTLTRGPS